MMMAAVFKGLAQFRVLNTCLYSASNYASNLLKIWLT